MTRPDEIPPLQGRRILVVEDQYLLADDLRRLLEQAGATVIGPAPNLEKGLSLARSETVHAAILDINLDGELVFPVAAALRDRGVPVVFTTGYDEVVIPPEFRGERRFEKPVSGRDIVALLAERLRPGPGAS